MGKKAPPTNGPDTDAMIQNHLASVLRLMKEELKKTEQNRLAMEDYLYRLKCLSQRAEKLENSFLMPYPLLREINDLIISFERILYPELYPELDSELE